MGEGSEAGAGDGVGPVLLFDGECGLCAASVQFVLRHEQAHTLRFAPLQGAYAAAARQRHPALNGVESMVWVEPLTGGRERVLLRSDAALAVAGYLGGGWRFTLVGRLVPRPLRDRLYDAIARRRHAMFGTQACAVPSPDQRGRFLA